MHDGYFPRVMTYSGTEVNEHKESFTNSVLPELNEAARLATEEKTLVPYYFDLSNGKISKDKG